MASGYPRSKLPHLVGLTRRQIAYLAERELVVPSLRGPSGRGSATIYSWEDLLLMATLRRILEITRSEMAAKQAATVVQALRGISQQPLDSRWLIVDRESAFLVDEGQAVGALKGSDGLLLVPLEPIEAELRRQLLREGFTGPGADDQRQRAA